MRENYGKIDKELARKFLSDHYDSFEEAYNPGSRTLCGHVEYDPRGLPEWGWDAYYPGGAIDAKVTDSEWASQMKFHAKFGHSCEIPFLAKPTENKYFGKLIFLMFFILIKGIFFIYFISLLLMI